MDDRDDRVNQEDEADPKDPPLWRGLLVCRHRGTKEKKETEKRKKNKNKKPRRQPGASTCSLLSVGSVSVTAHSQTLLHNTSNPNPKTFSFPSFSSSTLSFPVGLSPSFFTKNFVFFSSPSFLVLLDVCRSPFLHPSQRRREGSL